MSLQPWPEEVLPLRQAIQTEQERLRVIFEVCLLEGIEEQNYRLIKAMLPKIKGRAERIQASSREIRQAAPRRRRGRDPKWAIVVLEINALAARILKCAEIIRQEYPANRFMTIEYLLKVGLELCQKIEQHLDTVPLETDIEVPAAFRLAFKSGWREE